MAGVCHVICAKGAVARDARSWRAAEGQNAKRLQTDRLPCRKPTFAHEPAAQPIVTVPGFATAASIYHRPRAIDLAALHDRAIRGEADAPVHRVAGQHDE